MNIQQGFTTLGWTLTVHHFSNTRSSPRLPFAWDSLGAANHDYWLLYKLSGSSLNEHKLYHYLSMKFSAKYIVGLTRYLTFLVNPLFRMWQRHGFTPPYSPLKLGRFLPRLLLDKSDSTDVTHQYSLYLDYHAWWWDAKKGGPCLSLLQSMFLGTAVVSIFLTTSSGASSKRVPRSHKIS